MTLRASRRLSLGLALASLLPALAVLTAAGWLYCQGLQEEKNRRSERAASLVRQKLQESENKLKLAVQALLENRRMEQILVEMVRGEAEEKSLVHLAREWMKERGLAALTLIDGKGQVISCGHLPARFGEIQQDLLQASSSAVGPFLRREAVLEEGAIRERLFMVMLGRRSFEDAQVAVMAGELLEGDWLDGLERLTGAELAVADEQDNLLFARAGKTAGDKWQGQPQAPRLRLELPSFLGAQQPKALLLVEIPWDDSRREAILFFSCLSAVATLAWLLFWQLARLWLRPLFEAPLPERKQAE